MNLDSPITAIKGVGEKSKESFEKIGVYTVGDILLHFPRDYTQYPKAIRIPSQMALADGMIALHYTVTQSPVVKKTPKMSITVLSAINDRRPLSIVWYRMPYIKNTIIPGKQYVFYGRLLTKNNVQILEQPAVFSPKDYEAMENKFFPVYGLTNKLSNNAIMKAIRQALADEMLLVDCLPDEIRSKNCLCEYNYAIKQIHFPDTMDTLIEARRRLVFDEFFEFILGMQYQKDKQTKEANGFSFYDEQFVHQLLEMLPYKLTNAQLRTLQEIITDMKSPYVMQRLIQGDVGSGKTIIAFLLMAWTSKCGYQSAIMAPTEVLARQHYDTFVSLCKSFGLDCPVILLTGSFSLAQKKKIYAQMKTNTNALIIGTHALIQEKALYENLALVITDEQHRFGVNQRNTFSEKGYHPHILVMSATPIPRTLAIIIYGDMDISVIDEVPAVRLPIKNCVVNQSYRTKAYAFIEEQVKKGHQAYVICPLVEETENVQGENVVDYAQKLQEYYNGRIQVGLLHGKMKNEQKNQIMEQFSKNEIQVLVSTTVVEVGVNVPNATVMMIEDANRFGLAQLHQLRGRVGRGDAQSYCIMINGSNSTNSKKRLEILNKSNDGFFIASEDLKLRGPGDFFGIRQSGDLAFALADIYQDADVLMLASNAVHTLLEEDPQLLNENHALLKQSMQKFIDEQLHRMNL